MDLARSQARRLVWSESAPPSTRKDHCAVFDDGMDARTAPDIPQPGLQGGALATRSRSSAWTVRRSPTGMPAWIIRNSRASRLRRFVTGAFAGGASSHEHPSRKSSSNKSPWNVAWKLKVHCIISNGNVKNIRLNLLSTQRRIGKNYRKLGSNRRRRM